MHWETICTYANPFILKSEIVQVIFCSQQKGTINSLDLVFQKADIALMSGSRICSGGGGGRVRRGGGGANLY